MTSLSTMHPFNTFVNSGNARTPGLDYGSANFSRRERNGSIDGSLTWQEQARVSSARGDYNLELAVAKMDGTVTRDERQDLRSERRQVSSLIRDLRHNQFGNMASYHGGFRPEDWAQVPKGPGGGFPQPPVQLPIQTGPGYPTFPQPPVQLPLGGGPGYPTFPQPPVQLPLGGGPGYPTFPQPPVQLPIQTGPGYPTCPQPPVFAPMTWRAAFA